MQVVALDGVDRRLALKVLGRFARHHVEHVVVRDDPQESELVVHHRRGQEVVAGEQLRHHLGVLIVAHGDEVGLHDLADESVPRRQDQVAQR